MGFSCYFLFPFTLHCEKLPGTTSVEWRHHWNYRIENAKSIANRPAKINYLFSTRRAITRSRLKACINKYISMGPEKGEMHVLSRPTRSGQNLSNYLFFFTFSWSYKRNHHNIFKNDEGKNVVLLEKLGSSGQMALHYNPMEKLWYL